MTPPNPPPPGAVPEEIARLIDRFQWAVENYHEHFTGNRGRDEVMRDADERTVEECREELLATITTALAAVMVANNPPPPGALPDVIDGVLFAIDDASADLSYAKNASCNWHAEEAALAFAHAVARDLILTALRELGQQCADALQQRDEARAQLAAVAERVREEAADQKETTTHLIALAVAAVQSDAPARTTAAVEAMRERATVVCDNFRSPQYWPGGVYKSVGERDAADGASEELATMIRALPVDGGDALAERLAAEYERGEAAGYSSRAGRREAAAERRGAERGAKEMWNDCHPVAVERDGVQTYMREQAVYRVLAALAARTPQEPTP